MDDLWAEMDSENSVINKSAYDFDWAVLAIFT
jgi:hypothetical protein